MAILWVRPWSQKGSQDTLFTKFLERPPSHGSAQSQVNNSPRRSKGHLSLGMMQHMTTQLGFSVMEPKNNGAAIRWATISSGNISFVIRSTRPHLSPIPPPRHYGLSARTSRLHKPPNIRYCAAHDDTRHTDDPTPTLSPSAVCARPSHTPIIVDTDPAARHPLGLISKKRLIS